jgi:hypothetical protein
MADGVPSRGFGDLDSSVLAGSPRDSHDALPFPYLIDGPRAWIALVESLGVFTAGIQVDGFGEAFVENLLQQTVAGHAVSLEGHVRQKCQDLFGVLKRDFVHHHRRIVT